jgi:hypothetical protein
MKRGKEISLETKENYKVKLGTIDNKDPRTIYLNVSAWGEPLTEEDNYDSVLNNLRKKVKQKLFTNIKDSNYSTDRYIVDLDMRSSGMSKTKRSYMSCEITLFQKDRIPVNNPMTISEGSRLVNNLIDDCFECNNHFRFYKTKK